MRSKVALFIFALILAIVPALGQNGTQHGVNITWNAVPAAAGYNIYRCTGTCTVAAGVFTKIDATLDLTNGYLDQSSSLVSGTVYSYVATAVDSNGNESPYSNVATVTYTVVTNPPAPTGCSAKSQ